MVDHYFNWVQEIEEHAEHHHPTVKQQLKRHYLIADQFWMKMKIRLLESLFHDVYNLI